ncbi:hypothetical protein [Pseudomonas paralcaligenes]|uniref:hypothetical protein n=1 Tax=Pseudomonas paralcaligenes TaxID=2772558 RepID=UPI001C7F6C01|nr:hypothetical protein [Pseudomonas paralcaligenes]
MIDLDKLKKISPRDGDLLITTAGVSEADARELMEAISQAVPGIRITVVSGPLELITEQEMNAAGWHRKDEPV